MVAATAAGTQRRRNRADHITKGPEAVTPKRTRHAEPAPSDDLVQAFLTRSTRALGRIAEHMSRERLLEAVGEATDTDVLFRSLRDAAAIGAEIAPDQPDPLTDALLRGAERKRELLKAEGGALSGQQLAEHLAITTQGLGKKRDKNQVFWLEVGDGYVYPAFQVGTNGLLPGVREVLAAFQVDDPWMRVHFMLTGDRRLGGARPIDILREGEADRVVEAAAAYGEHGAA
jgi:hypothetical protein